VPIPQRGREDAVATVEQKSNGRPKGTFYGDDKGTWRYTEGYPLGLRKEGWDWWGSIALSSKNDWKNLSVEGASEDNRGFRQALQKIVREYPEVGEYLVSFDGPYMPVSKLVSVVAPKPDEDIDLGSRTYYHGTSDDVLDEILRVGLKPRGETNVNPTFGVEFGARPSRELAVYLTTQLGLASSAASSAARQRKGRPVILEVRGLSHNLFQPDEDSGEMDAVKSLERMGSVAYVGAIRPNKIKVHAIDDGQRWVKQATVRVAHRWLTACGDHPCQCGGECQCGGSCKSPGSLSMQPDYGTSSAALPRGASAQRVASKYRTSRGS